MRISRSGVAIFCLPLALGAQIPGKYHYESRTEIRGLGLLGNGLNSPANADTVKGGTAAKVNWDSRAANITFTTRDSAGGVVYKLDLKWEKPRSSTGQSGSTPSPEVQYVYMHEGKVVFLKKGEREAITAWRPAFESRETLLDLTAVRGFLGPVAALFWPLMSLPAVGQTREDTTLHNRSTPQMVYRTMHDGKLDREAQVAAATTDDETTIVRWTRSQPLQLEGAISGRRASTNEYVGNQVSSGKFDLLLDDAFNIREARRSVTTVITLNTKTPGTQSRRQTVLTESLIRTSK